MKKKNKNKGREEDDFFLEMSDDDASEAVLESDPSFIDGDDTIGPDHETVVMDEFAEPDSTHQPTPNLDHTLGGVEPTEVESSHIIDPPPNVDKPYDPSPDDPLIQDAETEPPCNAMQDPPRASQQEAAHLADLQTLANEISELKAERDKFKEQLIRKAADLDNYRKRVARDREDQKKYGNEKFALELLPVLDNMERALDSIPKDDAFNPLRDGVDMVFKQLISALKRFGVESFESKGMPFDPQKHEAIQQVESDTLESGTIVDQFQKGYYINDRLLRPAMVSVVKNIND